MKHPSYFIAPDRLILVLLAAMSLYVTGCATTVPAPDTTRVQFEEHSKDRDYSTKYVYSDTDSTAAMKNFRPLPRGQRVFVRLYNMYLAPSKINPCSYLTIHKDVYIQRSAKAAPALEEIREFYTDGGTLIATKSESVGNQLRTTGYYTGDTSLPIPPKAPPGKYRIVSMLVMKSKNRHNVTVLARTSASFAIMSRR